MRAGVSFVQADLADDASFPPPYGIYRQTDRSQDILGNLGFGLSYALYSGTRLRVGLQFEGEGFYGHRSQESQENFMNFVVGPTAKIDNDLYGGIGRMTLRFQYELGETGYWKLYSDVGMQVRYTLINYAEVGTPSELLWGPYVKLGIRYSF